MLGMKVKVKIKMWGSGLFISGAALCAQYFWLFFVAGVEIYADAPNPLPRATQKRAEPADFANPNNTFPSRHATQGRRRCPFSTPSRSLGTNVARTREQAAWVAA
jgi:hypothetical protein